MIYFVDSITCTGGGGGGGYFNCNKTQSVETPEGGAKKARLAIKKKKHSGYSKVNKIITVGE